MDTPTTVDEVLKSIARDIRRYGHYQKAHTNPSDGIGALYGKHENPAGLCCVNVNPTLRGPHGPKQYSALAADVYGELQRRVGMLDIVGWNDTTPTDEVLRVLEGAR